MNYKTIIKRLDFTLPFFNVKYSLIPLLIVSILAIPNTFAQTTWTGTVNTDWFDASNWSDGVPDANDDVTIGSSANDPVIAGTSAFANSILVNENSVLAIDASGTLEVQLINSSLTSNAITVLGTINNSGTIIVGATASGFTNGIELGDNSPETPGAFNNLTGSLLQISDYSNNAIFIPSAVGNNFINDGAIDIDGLGGSIHGIQASVGTFTNSTNGVITIENIPSNSIWIFKDFVFENNGSINIGLDSAVGGSRSIDTQGTFNNQTSGTIDIRGFSNRGIYAGSGTDIAFPGEFNNSGSINLDGELGAGAYGIVVQGQYSTFNNLTGGTIFVKDVSTLGISTGFGQATDSGSIFNNSGNIETLGEASTINQGVGVWYGTFNHDAGLITVDNASIAISLFSGGPGTSTFNNSSDILTQNLPFATSDIVSGPEGSFIHNTGGSITGYGQINTGSYVNNGGSFIPGQPLGVIRINGDADLSNSVIDLDINGGSTAGTDYDKIENNPFGDNVITLGGTLNLNITYTPSVDLEYITIIEAGSTVIGEFSSVNGLPPTEWEILYNFPSEGQVSLEFGAINSVQSGTFNDPNTWADGIIPNANTPAVVEDGHTVTLDLNQTFEVGRLQVNESASVVIPETSGLVVNNSTGTSVLNSGTIDVGGSIVIDGSQSLGIDNTGTINLNGSALANAIVDITNTTDTAIKNSGDFTVDIATLNIDMALIGIENSNIFTITENGELDLDFIVDTAVLAELGSELTNNGDVLIGRDPSTSNSIGQYGIDLFGYVENTATGVIEIANAVDTAILFNEDTTITSGRNAIDGTFENNGIVTLFSNQTASISQSDNASQIKGKYKHKLKKRPTPNPGRDINALPSFLNQLLSLLQGSGVVETDLSFLNGGIIAPSAPNTETGIIVFDGDEDFQNITLEIDVNGKTLKGTDYDLIASTGAITLGGDLDVSFGYTPEEGDVITFIEATQIIGTFNNPTLPMDWTIVYDMPNPGNVSLQFGDALSIDDDNLDDLVIYKKIKKDEITILGVLKSETKANLYDITGRLVLEVSLDNSNTHNIINTSKLASGTYILKLESKLDVTKTKKLIID